MVSNLVTLFALFRQTTKNFSFNSSRRIGTKNSAISLGEVIFLSVDHFDCD